MKRNELSVRQQVFLDHTLGGILLLAGSGAILLTIVIGNKLLDQFLTLFYIAALLVKIILMVYAIRANKEKTDEMARMELYKAKSGAMTWVVFVLLCLSLAVDVPVLFDLADMEVVVNLKTCAEISTAVIYAYLGFVDLLTGLLFKKQEEGDDDDEY